MTGFGVGAVAICNFLPQIVFADQRVTAVITDPEKGNVGIVPHSQMQRHTIGTNESRFPGQSEAAHAWYIPK